MKTKNYKGITLIALVVTIIVLLILAGVSISAITGNNGIIKQAINASTATDIAETKEQIQLELFGALNNNGKYTVGQVLQIAKEITGNDVDTEAKTVESANGNTIDISDILDGAIISWYYTVASNGEMAVTNGTVVLTIGDYINYEPTSGEYTSLKDDNGYNNQIFNVSTYTDAGYSWRVLGANEETGELLITTSNLVTTTSGGYFYMYGRTGFTNCITELDNISAIFGKGYGATGARSITIEDVNKLTGYDPKLNPIDMEEINEYGNKVTFYWQGGDLPYYSASNNCYGSLSEGHDVFYWWTGNSWSSVAKSNSASESSKEEIITLVANEQLYYGEDYIDTSSKAADMLFNLDSSYWLGNRGFRLKENGVHWRMRCDICVGL